SPSKLATFQACPLRYLLETENLRFDALKPHPATLLGTAVHEVAEALLSTRQNEAASLIGAVEASFARLANDRARASPMVRWVLERCGIPGLVSRRQLVEQAAFAKRLVDRFAPAQERGGDHRIVRSTIPIGSERWLASEDLGMAGKVDLVC